MSYGLKYQSSFDNKVSNTYNVKIYEKNYSGSTTTFLLAGTPAIQEWQVDDPKAAIKGCQLTVNIINDGTFPLSNFYALEDDTFLCEFLDGTDLKFKGYLVQDEISELMTDRAHEISIKFTDNLALLKDITFNEAAKLWGTQQSYTRLTTTVNIADTGTILIAGGAFEIPIGTVFTLSGTSGDGTYTAKALTFSGGVFTIFTTEPIAAEYTNETGDIEFILPIDLTGYQTFAEILAMCLKSTYLELDTKVSTTIICDGATTDRFLEETYVKSEDYLNGNNWDSCYTVAEKILTRFNATLFQADGVWNIVRWDELRRTDNTIPSYIYDVDFVYQSSGSLSTVFTYGTGNDIETGEIQTIERQWKFAKETFNFNRPTIILKNIDLLSTGTLLNSYTSGPNTVYEYEWLYWGNGSFAPFPSRFIRVVKDAGGFDVDRYAVIDGATGDDYTSAKGTSIEVNAGSRITFSLDILTLASQAGPGFIRAAKLELFDGSTTYTLKNTGEWLSGSSAPNAGTISIFTGDNSNNWHTFEVKSDEFPVDGLLTVYIAQADQSGTGETHIKNISFDILYSLDGNAKITGQTHTRTQSLNIKNQLEREIFLDDVRINTLKGVMFLSSTAGVLRDKTSLWAYYAASPDYLPLGQLTTFDNLFWRRVQRTKIEANLIGLVQSGNHLSMSSIIRNDQTGFDTKNFVFGRLAIDYKNNTANCTMFEMWDDAEVNDTDLVSLYEFKYLYDKI